MSDVLSKYFMPYQANYINDKSRFKFTEKSRRIGMTYAESYDNTVDAALGKIDKVWFSSADLSASEEFIDYVGFWARTLNIAASDAHEVLIDSENDITAHRVKFTSDSVINAISSNPNKFRSKGGRIIFDEYAHHANQEKLMAAGKASTLWGAEMRIISTHNGEDSYYNQLLKEINKGAAGTMKRWKLHRTTLEEAIKQGLLHKILGHEPSEDELAEFLEDCYSGMTQEAIDEEFNCIPRSDSSSHLLSYELINIIERDKILYDCLSQAQGNLFVGIDVGRKNDPTSIMVGEEIGELIYTRLYKRLVKMPFAEQEAEIYKILDHPKCVRAGFDASGLGMQMAENAEKKYGEHKINKVTFTMSSKDQLASHTYTQVENCKVLIPRNKTLRDSLYKVRAVTSASGATRYVADRDGKDHADDFWSLSLMLDAAKGYGGNIKIYSANTPITQQVLNNNYYDTSNYGRY